MSWVNLNDIYLQQTEVDDYVVEQGTSDIWTYRKWDSGFVECWGSKNFGTSAVTSAWGSIYQSTETLSRQTFPVVFDDVPCVIADGHASNGTIMGLEHNAPTTTQTPEYLFLRPTQLTLNNCTIDYYVCGYEATA